MRRLFLSGSGERPSSKRYVDTGYRGVSRSHHRRPIGLPLNLVECELLSALVKSLAAIDADAPLARLIDYTLAANDTYDLIDTHVAAIFALESWLSAKSTRPHRAISRWLAACRSELAARVAQVPVKPTDYRRPARLSCTCADCRELSAFLADPDEAVHRFRVRKDRRQHLHQIIDRDGCDLTHITDRRGSPQTLVCTKTTASYEAACKVHARDQTYLSRLDALAQKIG